MNTTLETALTAVGENMAAIDPTAFTEEMARNTEYIDEVNAAIAKARKEVAELSETIVLRDRNGPDQGAIADALLEGRDPETAGSSVAELEARKSSLMAGMAGLRGRLEGLEQHREALRKGFADQFAAAAEPLLQPMLARAAEAAGQLLAAYVDVAAATIASGNPKLAALRSSLEQPVAHLLRADILSEPSFVPSAELTNSFDQGGEAMELARRAFPSAVQPPQVEIDHNAFRAGLYTGHGMIRPAA